MIREIAGTETTRLCELDGVYFLVHNTPLGTTCYEMDAADDADALRQFGLATLVMRGEE